MPLRNEHVNCPKNVNKSLSYKVFEVRKKLKSEFKDKSSKEIERIVNLKGRDFITETKELNPISFSGDTPVDNFEKWDKSNILIHESTFLKTASDNQIESRGK